MGGYKDEMPRFTGKISKLLMALQIQKNKIYLLNRKQVWSKKLKRRLTHYKLTEKGETVLESWSELPILLFLAAELKEN